MYHSINHHFSTIHYNYDHKGNLINSIFNASFYPTALLQRNERKTSSDYDVFGNIISTTNELVRTTMNSYDSLGRFVDTIISPSGLKTLFEYDKKYGTISKTKSINRGDSTIHFYDA